MQVLRAILFMTASMACLALSDLFIKLSAQSLPPGQVMFFLSLGGTLLFMLIAALRGIPLVSPAFWHPTVMSRNLAEVLAALGMVTGIAWTPLPMVAAIMQTTPLLVTLGAALFLGDPVGWRRWSAILVGMLGVLLVIRPGMDSFQALSLLAVLGVLGLSLRDLATRRVPKSTSTFQLSFLAFLALVPASLLFMLGTGTAFAPMTGVQWLFMGAALTTGMVAYYGIVAAMRIGEISFVTPFRYARLLFAMVVGITIFGERPDLLTYVGATIIVASGIYTVWRERKVKEQA
ncbi:DMT family transporter [uncultured Sulfitobacter sp.]|uniref:DMT family transporter n=1 Tax=uncultured Sulfitobacter sp. TaxID=191468 RepID=UPI00259A0483|nr:DMT family transporter [uncultured Sulfitobacter sp.]